MYLNVKCVKRPKFLEKSIEKSNVCISKYGLDYHASVTVSPFFHDEGIFSRFIEIINILSLIHVCFYANFSDFQPIRRTVLV